MVQEEETTDEWPHDDACVVVPINNTHIGLSSGINVMVISVNVRVYFVDAPIQQVKKCEVLHIIQSPQPQHEAGVRDATEGGIDSEGDTSYS